MRRSKLFIVVIIFMVTCSGPFVQAKNNNMMKTPKSAPIKTGDMDDPSGIKPIFPKKISCVQISSPYGSRTRYDGSLRPENRFNGRHGGIDLSLNPGTPLLAVASGKLVHKAMGNQMEGIYLWLLHSPDDTGLDYWVFSKYQHLQNLPTIDMGDNVIKGQVIAYSGKTGTSGGHYGSKGYPHLHLSTIRSFSGKYLIENNELLQKSALLFDPLLIFKQPHQEIKKKVLIPYKDSSGKIRPEGSLTVWPVACTLF